MKYHLWQLYVHQTATYEEFGTLLVKIEACLNSQPLCVLPNDPHSSYLFPGHFLIEIIPHPTTYHWLLTSKWVDCPGGRHNNNSRTTGRIVCQLPSRAATPTTLAPFIPQHTTWRSCDPEGRQHGSTSLAYSGHYWCPSRRRRQDTSGHSQDPRRGIQTPNCKNLPPSAC